MVRSNFVKGLCHGIPIALGYFSVSFGFGIMAVKAGLSIIAAVGISVTNLTSAGQVAGVGIIAAGGTYLEMALAQLIINMRYGLMGISLSQKLASGFNTPRRLIVSYGITDEIFAVASSQKGKITARYMYGLIFISFIGWTAGTFFGAAAGNLMPIELANAMGILLYGMFLAIIIPPARKSRGVLSATIIAAVLSMIFKYLLTAVSGGFAVIICSVIASAAGALLFPVTDEDECEVDEV